MREDYKGIKPPEKGFAVGKCCLPGEQWAGTPTSRKPGSGVGFMVWVSVKDKLPGIREIVLSFNRYGVYNIDERISSDLWSSVNHWYVFNIDDSEDVPEVTHWMPLPEPPTGE